MIGGKLSSKKEKKKLGRNNSFSAVGTKKFSESRRKSIATLLPTPSKKKKELKIVSEWTVSEFDKKPIKRKQLVVTDNSEKFVGLTVNTVKPLETPKAKKKKSKSTNSPNKERKSDSKSGDSLTKVQNVIVHDDNEKEEKFGIKADEIGNAVEAVIKIRQKNPKLQNQLFEERIPLYLNVSCHKVPTGPQRIIRIQLPNSILTPDDEICLIVPEVKGIKNVEHEKHVEHYEDLLRRKGVNNIKKIMTLHELRTEHETFQQKHRLVNLYDMFLVDGRISGKVVSKCGQIFYKKRKVPTCVKLQATKLKENIDRALSKSFFMLHTKGDSYNIQFGHDKMQTEDLVENAFAVIESLNREFPGGFDNLKGIHVTAMRAATIPIYCSFKNPQKVKIPKLQSKKPKAYKIYKGELTTLPNADVIVEPSGRVFVQRTEVEEENESEIARNTNTAVKKIKGKDKNKVKKTKKRKPGKRSDVVSITSINPETEEVTISIKKNVKKTKKRKHIEVEA